MEFLALVNSRGNVNKTCVQNKALKQKKENITNFVMLFPLYETKK